MLEVAPETVEPPADQDVEASAPRVTEEPVERRSSLRGTGHPFVHVFNSRPIADAALTKISQRLDDLDPKDIRVADIPRLLEAVLRVQQHIVGEPTETRQPGQLMSATEIRLALKAGLFSDPVEPEPSNPRLAAWIDGTLDDPNSPA